MTDVEDSAEMAPQRGVRFGDRDAGKLRNSRRCGAGIEMIFEVVDNFVRRFEKAIGFRFERQPDGAAASLFEFDQDPWLFLPEHRQVRVNPQVFEVWLV